MGAARILTQEVNETNQGEFKEQTEVPEDTAWEDDFDALLVRDAWDDFGYRTMFTLCVRTSAGWTEAGTVKIGQVSMDSDA
ncbi:hypothetical protein AQJ91_38050 [Streptomyces dysideae]|uniref:Uncharacterized protein n=2 Tax=Streptomyces dysideae TaxID=909626 RepID=A0A101USF9_9ACTN|nr:hypothetical protein AQJ91_38050 [Streptomyces dysideae]